MASLLVIEYPTALTQKRLKFAEREALRIILGVDHQFVVFGHIVTIYSYSSNCQENRV